MLGMTRLLICLGILGCLTFCSNSTIDSKSIASEEFGLKDSSNPAKKTDAQWRQELTKEEYRVLREKGTEPPNSSPLLYNKAKGVYVCAGCATKLFSSETKFESGTGWPSFYEPIDSNNVGEVRDVSLGMIRTEVICNTCQGHLGHVFNDGPKDKTGLRYCLNGVALDFIKDN